MRRPSGVQDWLWPWSPRAKFRRTFSLTQAKNAAKFWQNILQLLISRKSSEKLEKAGTVDFKKHPARKVGTRSRQCRPKVPGRFAFPDAQNPRICSISRCGNIFPAIFPEFSRRTPEQTPETATAFSSFLKSGRKIQSARQLLHYMNLLFRDSLLSYITFVLRASIN